MVRKRPSKTRKQTKRRRAARSQAANPQAPAAITDLSLPLLIQVQRAIRYYDAAIENIRSTIAHTQAELQQRTELSASEPPPLPPASEFDLQLILANLFQRERQAFEWAASRYSECAKLRADVEQGVGSCSDSQIDEILGRLNLSEVATATDRLKRKLAISALTLPRHQQLVTELDANVLQPLRQLEARLIGGLARAQQDRWLVELQQRLLDGVKPNEPSEFLIWLRDSIRYLAALNAIDETCAPIMGAPPPLIPALSQQIVSRAALIAHELNLAELSGTLFGCRVNSARDAITALTQTLKELSSSAPLLTPQLIVDIVRCIAILRIPGRGEETFESLCEPAARWLAVLANVPGKWFTPSELETADSELAGIRVDRLRKTLPRKLASLVKAEAGRGTRLTFSLTRARESAGVASP